MEVRDGAQRGEMLDRLVRRAVFASPIESCVIT